MIKLKEIPLLPSKWMLDVVESKKDDHKLQDFISERYGLAQCEIDKFEQMLNICTRVSSGTLSYLKGEIRVLIIVQDLKRTEVLVHELVHALWYTANLVGYEMTYETQEWQAVMFEYLFEQATDLKSYRKVQCPTVEKLHADKNQQKLN